MPQLFLEINQTIFDKIGKMAQREHTTISYWVENNIRHFIEEDYPEDFFELFGAINDETYYRKEGWFNMTYRRKKYNVFFGY